MAYSSANRSSAQYTHGGGGGGARHSYASPPPPAAAGALPQFSQASVPPPKIPPGTLPPGTIVRVGEYEVRVERFLSEGGFAHVYLATSSTPIPAGSPNATTKHVLKRMAVPDTKGVEEVGKEVEVMKLLRNHPRIVNLIEASVSELPGGTNGSNGYEIYILMEWCAGGGIIDMMNTRLQNRLTESEILKVFSDTVEAVAHMHYQSPPLIHRDLKVENILLSPPQTYKLCDFGSTCKPMPREKVPTAVEALQKMELEINKTTTLQYRAPEIVDIWSRKGFDEKIDIWALGVFLYKLCYYTTPFEEHGPLAILNAQYKIPPYPAYSNNIKGLIQGMLQESAARRPNIYQVHEQVCGLRGMAVKLENKYASSAQMSTSSSQPSSAYSDILSSGPVASAASSTEASVANTISPMRRGRPAKAGTPVAAAHVQDDPARMIKTGGEHASGHEWQPMGSNANGSPGASAWPLGKSAPSTGSNGFGDSFTSAYKPSSLAAENGARSGSPSAFGDSFAPAPTSTVPSSLAGLISPPATSAGLGRASPALRGLAAISTTRPSSAPPAKVSDLADDPDKAAFEGKFPSLDDFPGDTFKTGSVPPPAGPAQLTGEQPPHPSASTKSLRDSFESSLVTSPPQSQPKQLTGESSAGPALPRRPPVSVDTAVQVEPRRNSSKPELVSRSSQTSPHLLAGYPLPSAPDAPSSGLKQSSLPYLNRSPNPTPTMSPEPIPLPGMAHGASRSRASSAAIATAPTTKPRGGGQPSFDLLGDDPDNDDAFAPKPMFNSTRPTASPGPMAQATLPPLTQPVLASAPAPTSAPLSFENRRMSYMNAVGQQDLGSASASREKFRPVKPAPADVGLSTSLSSGSAQQLPPDRDGDANERFPSLEDLDARSPAPSAARAEPSPDDFEPIVDKEDKANESSDDEPVVEDFAPRPRPKDEARSATEKAPVSLSPAIDPKGTIREREPPAPTRFDSIDSVDGEGGDIDLGPALASIHRFAPMAQQDELSSPPMKIGSPPPLLAPKPQSFKRQQQISNLVSRYDSVSLDETSKDKSDSATKRAPPPATTKPQGLRKDSIGSQSSAAGGVGIGAGDVNKKPRPQWGSKPSYSSSSSSATAAAPAVMPSSPRVAPPRSYSPSTHTPAPSSPAVPRTPTSASSATTSFTGAARGGGGGGGGDRPPPFKPSGPPMTPGGTRPLPPRDPPQKQAEEEEERFAGVSNMKNRWEQMTRAQQEPPSSSVSRGPGQPKGGARKEWAAV